VIFAVGTKVNMKARQSFGYGWKQQVLKTGTCWGHFDSVITSPRS